MVSNTSTSSNPTDKPAATFADILAAELDQIALRRARHDLKDVPQTAPNPALEQEEETRRQRLLEKARHLRLVGLAFSGGGIRSATFNLGVLQALAKLDLLRYIDYLSTVSGGSYIGSWFAAWVLRTQGGLDEVQKELMPDCPPRQLAGR